MIKNPGHIVVSLLILLFAGVSCIKSDLDEMDKDLEFSPEYSLPIGGKEITINEYLPSDLSPLADTIGISKDQIFYYDDKYYEFDSVKSTYTTFIAFDFNKLSKNFESVESLMFRVNAINEIPAQFSVQIFFSNATGLESQLLFSNYTIEAAKYLTDGSYVPTEQYEKDTYYDKNTVQSFLDKKTIIINIGLLVENPTDEIIEYLSSQSLKVQLALRLSFESTPNEI